MYGSGRRARVAGRRTRDPLGSSNLGIGCSVAIVKVARRGLVRSSLKTRWRVGRWIFKMTTRSFSGRARGHSHRGFQSRVHQQNIFTQYLGLHLLVPTNSETSTQ
jgi:hypothetical protein